MTEEGQGPIGKPAGKFREKETQNRRQGQWQRPEVVPESAPVEGKASLERGTNKG